MLIFLVFTLLLSTNLESSKALSLPPQPQTSGSITQATDNELESRTMWSIISACASTTFLCTWSSVHPNVPPEEGALRRLCRRLRLMFWALVVPELVLAWSAKQWYVAGRIAHTYNSNKGMKAKGTWESILSSVKSAIRGKQGPESPAWTRTHGHLIAMGGIVLVEQAFTTDDKESESPRAEILKAKQEEPSTILTPEILEDLLKDPNFEINITQEEIEDKAKGDFLSKSITIFHTTWFITQCVTRLVTRLAITEIEVVTLALASLNGIMSFFWWDKPLGLTVPMRIGMRKFSRKIDRGDEGFHTAIYVFVERYTSQIFEIFWHNQSSPWFLRWILYLPGYILMLFFLLIPCPIIFIARSIYRVMASNSIPPGVTHVPAFYSPRTDSEVMIFRIVFPIFGIVFGGLHCLSWTFTFPTEIEQKIWKFGSTMVTIIPLLYFLVAALTSLGDSRPGLSRTLKSGPMNTVIQVVTGLVAFIAIAVSWVYLAARIALLLDAVILLRRPPPSVFLEVDWTKYVPHIM